MVKAEWTNFIWKFYLRQFNSKKLIIWISFIPEKKLQTNKTKKSSWNSRLYKKENDPKTLNFNHNLHCDLQLKEQLPEKCKARKTWTARNKIKHGKQWSWHYTKRLLKWHWYDFLSGMSSFHLHNVFFSIPKWHFAPIQVIPVFILDETDLLWYEI